MFTTDWVSPHSEKWADVLEPFKGKPSRALEIGCFEGRATLWFLENVLTHPDSTMHCIDTFQGSLEHSHPNSDDKVSEADLKQMEARFEGNIREHRARVWKWCGKSEDQLGRFSSREYFDFIYVDGSHNPRDVMIDICFSWLLLRPGGVMILDDYGFSIHGAGPKQAIDPFLYLFREELSLLHKAWQVIVQKNPGETHGRY